MFITRKQYESIMGWMARIEEIINLRKLNDDQLHKRQNALHEMNVKHIDRAEEKIDALAEHLGVYFRTELREPRKVVALNKADRHGDPAFSKSVDGYWVGEPGQRRSAAATGPEGFAEATKAKETEVGCEAGDLSKPKELTVRRVPVVDQCWRCPLFVQQELTNKCAKSVLGQQQFFYQPGPDCPYYGG